MSAPMPRAQWRWGRASLRALLCRALPGNDWSAEFVDELDEDLARGAAAHGTGPALTVWYLRQLLSPATVGFVRASRARQRQRWHAMKKVGLATGWVGDARQAVRGLRRDPWLAALVVVTLAVGIGSVSAMVGLGQRLFLEGPPHVEAPEQLQRVVLEFDDPGGRRVSPWIPFNTAAAIRDSVDGFAAAALYRRVDELADFSTHVRPVVMGAVDADYFAVLGVQPLAGRFFGSGEPAALVVSAGTAVDEFGSAAGAVGESLQVGDRSGTIVGVTPAGFAGPDLDRIDVWTPLDPAEAGSTNWWFVGRLAPGTTALAALTEAQTVHEEVDPGRFFQWARDGRVAFSAVGEDPTGERSAETAIAGLLLAVVALVLLIAWINVLNLLSARITRRQGEVLVRLALGIGSWRLARLMLTESLLLSLVGGAASLPVAYGLGALIREVLLPGVAWGAATVNTDLMVVTFLVVLVSGGVLGLLSARQAQRSDLSGALAESRQTAGGRRARMQTVMVTGQVMLSAAMLLCAGLFVKSFWTMRVTDLGIDAANLYVVNLRSLDYQFGSGGAGEDELYQRALVGLRQGPAARHVAMAVGLPFVTGFGMSVYVDGVEEIPELPGGGPFISAISGGFFAAAGTEIVRGDPISDDDVATGAMVTVVGESTAAALWPVESPIGECVRIGAVDDPCYRVVGVAEDVHQRGYREPPSLMFYVPLGASDRFSGSNLIVREAGGPITETALAAEITAAIPEVDYVEVRRLESFLEAEIRPWKLGAVMLSMVAGLAILMSLAGVFGVLSYVVAQRRREIGVRMALGATGGAIRGLVLRQGLMAGLSGVFAGFAAVFVASRWLSPLLFETSVGDPLVLAATGCGLVLAALGACLLPASQAARVDPASSLRADA